MRRAEPIGFPEGWDRDTIVDFWGSLGHKWGLSERLKDGTYKVDLVGAAQRFLSGEERPDSVLRWISGIPEEELREVACFIVLRAGTKVRA